MCKILSYVLLFVGSVVSQSGNGQPWMSTPNSRSASAKPCLNVSLDTASRFFPSSSGGSSVSSLVAPGHPPQIPDHVFLAMPVDERLAFHREHLLVCELCLPQFANPDELARHLGGYHNTAMENYQAAFKVKDLTHCFMCTMQTFKSAKDLYFHIMSMHEDKLKMYYKTFIDGSGNFNKIAAWSVAKAAARFALQKNDEDSDSG